MKFKIIIAVIFSFLGKMAIGQNYPVWIDSLKINTPIESDSTLLISFITIGNPFYLRAKDINLTSNLITVRCCYQCGSINIGQSSTDTFNLGILPVGNYEIMYLAKHSIAEEYDNPEGCMIDTDYDTAILNLTVHPAVGIKEKGNYNFQLSPNPTQSTFTLQLSSVTGNTTLNLYNTIGSMVLQQNIQQPMTQVDVSTLPKGIYIAEVQTPQGRAVKKLVVE